MSITLKPELEQFIQEKINSGKYNTADEVISEAFRLLVEQEQKIEERQLEELRRKIAVGTEQIAQGRVVDGELVFTRLQERISRLSEPEE